MKRLALFVLIVVTLVPCWLSAQQRAARIQIPSYNTFTLDNGLRVILMEYHRLPIVELQLSIKGGSSLDPDSLVGLASITAGLLNRGTTTRSATKIAEEVDFIGGSLSAGAGVDKFTISSEFLKKDMDKGLELFADILLNPTFPQEEIERERSQRLATIQRYKEEPETIAGLYFNRLIFAGHPYGNQPVGTAASLKRMSRDAIVQFYQHAFLPNTSILVAVGDFKSDEMLARLKQRLGSWKNGLPLELVMKALPMHKGRRVVVVNKPDVTQTQIRIGNIGVDVKNPDWFAIQVANSILGQGFTSRLVDEIRVKRSLSYSAGSAFASYLQGGVYRIRTFTKNPTTRQTIDVALEEVKKFRENGARRQELSKAQNYLAGNFARELQAPENLTDNLSFQMFYGLPNDYLENYVAKLKSVTLDDVKRVVNKYFHYDDLIILVVTNPKETQSSLESLGKVEVAQVDEVIN